MQTIYSLILKSAIFILACSLTACTICPKPLSLKERYCIAKNAIYYLCLDQPTCPVVIDYYEALARSVKYNLDHRVKMADVALQAGQLDVAVFTMFPSLNISGSLYTRNNDLSVAGITGNGVSTGLTTSTPRTLLTARAAMSWNILDFGMSYVKVRQQGEHILISKEESRRELQQLAQDVLTAYWVAYSAQLLLEETEEFKILLERSKRILAKALKDPSVPKENILTYKASLLEGNRKLIQLQYKYDKAMSDLKHLLFLPVDQKIILAPPPCSLFKEQDLSCLNIAKMDAVLLVNHPQLRGQHYQERLARFGLKTVLLQALPGFTLNYGANYDSNKFLLNNRWLDKSVDWAWNLINLASLPYTYQAAKVQIYFENIKSMAMTMGALTENRQAIFRYQTLSEEYQYATNQAETAREIYILNRDRKLASVASDQQVILAKLNAITAKMDEDLLKSDLAIAIGQLYLTVGTDLVPECIISKPMPEAIDYLRVYLDQRSNFVTFIDESYYDLFRNLPV